MFSVDNHKNAPLRHIIVAAPGVNCLRGKSFQTAARRGAIELLELLVRSAPQPSSLSSAVPVAMRLVDSRLRMNFMVILLDHGAKGHAVDQALTEAIGETPLDEDLVLYFVNKANDDHHQGQALCNAVKCANKNIVASVIKLPATGDRLAKLDLLLRAGIEQEGRDKALVQEISNESHSDMDIIERLLDRGASCNYDGGKSLELAVSSRNNQLLRCLIDSKCESAILARMLPFAMHNPDMNTRYACMALLLIGGATGDQVSRALVHEIRLLRGQVIKHVVSTPTENEVLKLLLEGNGASLVLASLIPLAMNHAQESRLQILQTLLENGAGGAQVHVALIDAVKQGPHAQPTIDMLLRYHASVNYQSGEAIRIAAAAGQFVHLRLSAPEESQLRVSARGSQSCNADASRADWHKHPGSIQDHALVEHLIKSGGDPNFRSCESVVKATEQADIESLILVTRSKVSHTVFFAAFAAKSTSIDRWQSKLDLLLNIDKILPEGGAAGPAVD
ncbi:hypothetical protein HO173_005536 [Letharia columbiana]|uniref:Ankyrin repeat protein n=1 Tax=Letharia columbiana TaxID=112416 RepID=A0A8H6FWW6_9LECA|nr:uncharacterized protein HO173_005536 [Letharia columbiana]KAF6236283.1 hypothetical protein HO173_005536 [Letharia columbiana]